MLFGQKNDEEYTNQLKQEIPEDLLKHRYLMHPTRLVIMKLLFTEHSLSSVHIKNTLNVSWSDITPHIQSLISNRYIVSREQFTRTGSVRQFLYITQRGEEEFKHLFTLLSDFTKKSVSYDLIQGKEPEDSDLYPS